MGPATHTTLLTCLGALAAICAAPAAAKEERCDAKSAIATPIEAIQADYAAWAGKCVKVGGIGFGWKLYADRLALVEEPPTSWDNARRAIVIKPRSGPPFAGTPRRIEVVGRVGSCAADNAVADSVRTNGDLIVVMGYCHVSQANYVAPSSISVVDKAPVARLTATELPEEKRPLVSAPASLSTVGEDQAAARQMMRALMDGDEDRYVRLSEPSLIEDLDKKGLTPQWLRERLRDIHADYVPLRQLVRSQAKSISADAPLTSFIARGELSATDHRPPLIHCWCKTSDCAGRWPVTAADADNLRERPYFCIATNDYLLGLEHRTALQASVPLKAEGFAEPGVN